MLRFVRKYHKWPGIFSTFFILLFSISGILLNHREFFSGIDVPRSWLPENYRYKNWNLAAVKGGIRAGSDSLLVYGNLGIWRCDSAFTGFNDYNQGFPDGVDNRKVGSLVYSPDSTLWAGTLFGLYRRGVTDAKWHPVPLPVAEKRIVKVLVKGDTLWVLTRSNLLWAGIDGEPIRFSVITVPAATDDDGKAGLFRTLWVIHSGEIYGLAGKILVDIMGGVFIVLCVTGLIWFSVPFMLKRFNEPAKSRVRRFNRSSLRWHNLLGSWLLPVLILTTVTGMFLRPPLLIPIAGSRVAKIPFSELDSPNLWHDKFRDILYDESRQKFMVATSEGIYESDAAFGSRLKPFTDQPPVSVMGINVFTRYDEDTFLVGSFSGIYRWKPGSGEITDHFTGLPYRETGLSRAPFGGVSVAGYLKLAMGQEYIFDYAAGMTGIGRSPKLPDEMPGEIIAVSPLSLWNTSLEIHTGRIFEPLMGPLYILVVPLVGLLTLVILIAGFLSWWLARRRKARALQPDCEIAE